MAYRGKGWFVLVLLLLIGILYYIYERIVDLPAVVLVLAVGLLLTVWKLASHYDRAKISINKDPLTGVYNRVFVEEMFAKLVSLAERNNEQLAVCLVKVENLREINERFGQKKGDFLLKNVASCLQDFSRSSDVVARWNGNVFLILLTHTNQTVVESYTERIGRELHGIQVGISYSFGLAFCSRKAEELFALIRDASANIRRPYFSSSGF